jgi:flagellar hook-basal body complex protein FliE
VTAALALTGCGSSSSSKVSADSYVKSVCTSAGSWYRAIQVAGRRLQTTVHNSKSLSTIKSAYVDFVDSLLHATQRAARQVKNAGTPSVNGGEKVSSEVVKAFDSAQSGLKTAAAQVRNAPTGSRTALEAAAGEVQSSVQRALQSMSTLAPHKNPELHAAALRNPSCQRLRALG